MPKQNGYLVTLGTFDGVHLGHRKLMGWVLRKAKALGLRTRVVFFVVPPRFYFNPASRVPLLTSSRDRRSFVKALGIDRVEVLRFGPRWANMSHTDFFENYILKKWKAGGVLVGKDFGFGKGRKGDLSYLKEACARHALTLGVLPLVRVGGKKISSSDIRRLLLSGDVEKAGKLLGRPYSLTGKVARGKGFGRTLGFPTANVRTSKEALLPPGVFVVWVRAAHWPGYKRAVCNVGTRPTLGRRKKTAVLEVHIPGFKGGLYGRKLSVEFVRRLRPEKKFTSLSALRGAIEKDVRSLNARSDKARF
jgi:riboflavin kinase/FMN adenylyltransferase